MDRAKKGRKMTEYTRHDLVRLPGHPYFYENPLNKKKVYRKGKLKISTGLTSIKLAKKLVEEELIRRAGKNPLLEKALGRGVSNPSIKDCWEALLIDRSLIQSPATIVKCKQAWKHGIEPYWGNKTALDVNQITQEAYEKWYMANRGTKQFFNVRKYLRMLFRYMQLQDFIHKVPNIRDLDVHIATTVKRKKVGREFSKSEQIALLKACEGRAAWQYKGAVIIRLALFAGLRKMEAGNLLRANIDLINGTVTAWSSKNKNWRTVDIGQDTVIAIKELIAQSEESEFLFPMLKDPKRAMSGQLLDDSWHKAKARAGIAIGNFEARFHDLRHTFATCLARANVPVHVCCEILDMSMLIFQNRYTHCTDTDKKDAMAKALGWNKGGRK